MTNVTPDYDFARVVLANATLHFKLVFGLTATRPKIEYLDTFSFGRHVASREELALTRYQEDQAWAALEHCGTFLSAVQVHTVLEALFDDPFEVSEPDIAAAFQITRLLRNAFAHNPFAPCWQFGPKYDSAVFTVPGVISVDTSGLNGRPVKREHYGGPLAILRLIGFTENVVEKQRAT